MKRPRLIVTVLLMLILPWQGLAWALMPATPSAPACHSSAADDTPAHSHHTSAAHHSMTGDVSAGTDEDPGRDTAVGHHCCQHASSGAVTATWPGIPPAPEEQQSTVRHLVTLYIPDLPQRPPQDLFPLLKAQARARADL